MVAKIIAIALFSIIVGCTTIPKGSFCSIADPIRPSQATIDAMSDAEVAAALAHNEKLTRLCGVRP